jgi:hypothetical protein
MSSIGDEGGAGLLPLLFLIAEIDVYDKGGITLGMDKR